MVKGLINILIINVFVSAFFLCAAVNDFAQTNPIAADIQKIILETGDGFCFDCERVTTLRAGGESATYHGGKRSRFRRGDFSGEFAAKDFTRLVQTFINNGFFELSDRYEGATSDVAAVKFTVVFKGGSKTVVNFKRSSEARLKNIEQAFNRAAERIVWQTENAKAQTTDAFAPFPGAHAAAVKKYIDTRKSLRLALESDCENSAGLAIQREVYGAYYNPFYAVWDFNNDKIKDFAVGLFDESAQPDARFIIVVFKGASDKTYVPIFSVPKIDLSLGGIELNGPKKGVTELRLVHFQTEKGCTVLRWRNHRFVLSECPPEEN